LLDDGNTLYRRGRYEDAAHRYHYAVRRIPEDFLGLEESQPTFEQLKIHLLLNLSRCRRKQGQLVDAIAKATEVLSLRSDCLEALHARARAHRESLNFREAVQDLNEALRLSPQNRDIHRLILRVKDEMSSSNHSNNNELPPVGASMSDKLKFVDDSASEIGSSSAAKC
jgi:tetratricopeptide (TPR) repeat protein